MSNQIQRKKPEFKMTAAALAAAAKGDFANAVIAATPGGIEAQEAAGQRQLCKGGKLPKDINGGTREDLEKAGFVFNGDADDIFFDVTFPAGWKLQPTDHSMHSDLIDDKDRERAGMFYKAAFYDRSAHLSLHRRYDWSTVYCDETGAQQDRYKDQSHVRIVAIDRGTNTTIFDAGMCGSMDWDARKPLEKIAQDWLNENYPDWKSAAAYWD